MLWVKDRTDLFDFRPMLLHPKFDFDFENLIFFGETRIILGDKRNTEQMTPPEKLKFFFTFNLKFKT